MSQNLGPPEDFAESKANLRVAVIQAAPIFLERQKSVEKACRLIAEAAAGGASVVAFPESFIPSHPTWVEVLAAFDPKAVKLYKRLFRNAIEVPSPEVEALENACKEHNIHAVVGITERKANTTGTLYNTQLFITPKGETQLKHQKYVPTVGERVIHAPGETGGKASILTYFGTLSGLICGENSNPLAQYSLCLDYPVVHVASWPQHFDPGFDMYEAISVASRGLAYSLKCFVLNSVAVVDEDMIEAYSCDNTELRDFLVSMRGKGGSTIIGPGGKLIAGPLGPGEDILYADLDLEEVIVPKQVHDYAGHYNRPELFTHLFK